MKILKIKSKCSTPWKIHILSLSIAAVHNMKTVAHCVAKGFTLMRNEGLNPEKTTCVGHSLGRWGGDGISKKK